MKEKTKLIPRDLSEIGRGVKKLSGKGGLCRAQMKKHVSVRSEYFSSKKSSEPCARTLFELEIDCGLLKLLLWFAAALAVLWAFCSLKKRCKRK